MEKKFKHNTHFRGAKVAKLGIWSIFLLRGLEKESGYNTYFRGAKVGDLGICFISLEWTFHLRGEG